MAEGVTDGVADIFKTTREEGGEGDILTGHTELCVHICRDKDRVCAEDLY